jgi:hypothetical protein
MNFMEKPPTHIYGISTPVLFFGGWALGVILAVAFMVRYYQSRTRSNIRDDLHARPSRKLPPGPRR